VSLDPCLPQENSGSEQSKEDEQRNEIDRVACTFLQSKHQNGMAQGRQADQHLFPIAEQRMVRQIVRGQQRLHRPQQSEQEEA
jgi:hypothetical protein